MNPFAWAGDKFQNILILLFNFASSNPAITGAVVGWWVSCYIVVSIIHGLWPPTRVAEEDLPPTARILLQICEPFLGIIRAIISGLLNKVGIKYLTPMELK
jgi:uncharacterized protein YggT (Ycf19 family)